jgi:vancomycin resistance protein VanJ
MPFPNGRASATLAGMTTEPAEPTRKLIRTLSRGVATGLTLLFVIGMAIRLTVRDRYVIASTLFYATPWPVLAGLGVLTAWWWRRAGRAVSVMALLAATVCATGGVTTMWRLPSTQSATPPDFTVLTWNLGHGRWGLPELARTAATLEPDVAVFVEADPRGVDVRRMFQSAFPDHRVAMLGGGIAVVSRWPGGEARAYEMGPAKKESRVREIDLATPWGPITVFACDMASDVFYNRGPHFEELQRRIQACPNPVIVAGDFNTPLDSVHLETMRKAGLQEAFKTAGEGYAATWPLPAPVLSLDQIWTGRALECERCRREWSWRSDHAAVIADYRVKM